MQYTVTHAIVGARVHTLMYVFNSVGGIQTGKKHYISRGIVLHSILLQPVFSQCFFYFFIMKPQKLLHCPKSNPNFRDITWNVVENMILHELFRLVSRFPRYISCYIAESQWLPLGQCTHLLFVGLKKRLWHFLTPQSYCRMNSFLNGTERI